MTHQLYQYFNKYAPFTWEEIEAFCLHLETKTFARKEFLLREGDICRYQFFVHQGLVRSFYIDPKGNEQIVLFGIENWWVTNPESFVKANPSKWYIQALEKTTVWALSKSKLEQLFAHMPKLERVFRIMAENMLIAVLRRSEFRLQMNSEEMYQMVLRELPEFVQRIPQYMLASYLGMTPEHLSALRKNKPEKNEP